MPPLQIRSSVAAETNQAKRLSQRGPSRTGGEDVDLCATLCASITRRSELARVGPVFGPVLRRDFLFLAPPAAGPCPVSGPLVVRRPAAVWPAGRFEFRPIQRALLTTFDIRLVRRPPPFPSFHNDRGRRADHKPLHTVRF